MRTFLEKKWEVNGGASARNILKEAAVEGAQSSAVPHGEKRKSPEPKDSLEVLSGFDFTSGGKVKGNLKNQMCLHGFVTGRSSDSVWSDRFPYSALSERVAQSSSDFQLLNSAGKEAVGQYVQVVATRLMCVGRGLELSGGQEKRDAEKIKDLEKSLSERDGVIMDLTKRLKDLEGGIGTLQNQVCTLQQQSNESDIEKGSLTARIQELEKVGIEMFAASFDRAVSQVSIFVPDFDVG
ncbi:hypothetical protein S83_061631 [Arachis hypogaea]